MAYTLRMIALFAGLMAIFTAIGWLLGGLFMGDWVTGALFFLVLAGVINFVSYFWSDKIVLWSYRAKIVSQAEQPRLYNILNKVCLKADLPLPRMAVVASPTPNAFATGRNPDRAVVAVTEGIMSMLTDDELEGVLAHEMAHVKGRDILIMSVAATIAGAVSFAARMAWFGSWDGAAGTTGAR